MAFLERKIYSGRAQYRIEEHENAVGEVTFQLGLAVRQAGVPGMVASLGPSLYAPEGYQDENGKIRPDACIMNRKKKVNNAAVANRMAATDSGRFYPSVVVEVAFSQSENSLKEKVNAWLNAGNNRTGVRCVVEINIDEFTPPAWIKFRVHRRGQARVPMARKITLEQYTANPSNERYRAVLTAQEACYPADVPDGFDGVTLDVGQIYATLPGVDTTDDEELIEEEESNDEFEDQDSDDTPEDGGVLAKLRSGRGKHQRTAWTSCDS